MPLLSALCPEMVPVALRWVKKRDSDALGFSFNLLFDPVMLKGKILKLHGLLAPVLLFYSDKKIPLGLKGYLTVSGPKK